jgi:hypothetical protein
MRTIRKESVVARGAGWFSLSPGFFKRPRIEEENIFS